MISMAVRWPWSALGLPDVAPPREVKRAYATRLKQIDRADPSAFQALRQAYEAALRQAEAKDGTVISARPTMRAVLDGAETAPLAKVRETTTLDDKPPAHPVEPLAEAMQTPEPEAAPHPEVLPDAMPEPMAGPQPQVTRPRDVPPVIPSPAPVKPTENARPKADAPKVSLRIVPHEGTLDDLWAEDPASARRAFHARLQMAIKDRSLPMLSDLSETLMASDPAIHAEFERVIFDHLAEKARDPDYSVGVGMVSFLDATFGWLSDGVATARRLGFRPGFRSVMLLVSAGAQPHAPPPAPPQNLHVSVILYRAALVVVTAQVWTLTGGPRVEMNLALVVISMALIFTFDLMLLTFTVRTLPLIRRYRVMHLVDRAGAMIAPRAFLWMRRRPGAWGLARNGLAALLVMVLLPLV
jgi:hypothetical protein